MNNCKCSEGNIACAAGAWGYRDSYVITVIPDGTEDSEINIARLPNNRGLSLSSGFGDVMIESLLNGNSILMAQTLNRPSLRLSMLRYLEHANAIVMGHGDKIAD